MVANAWGEAWRRWGTSHTHPCFEIKGLLKMYFFQSHTPFTMMQVHSEKYCCLCCTAHHRPLKGLLKHQSLDLSSRACGKQTSGRLVGIGRGVVVLRLHFWQVLRWRWCYQSVDQTVNHWPVEMVVKSNTTNMYEAAQDAKNSTFCMCVCTTFGVKEYLPVRSEKNQRAYHMWYTFCIYISPWLCTWLITTETLLQHLMSQEVQFRIVWALAS